MSTTGPVLRDIHLPSAAWWPPAPGWWMLLALAAALAAFAAWWTWRRIRRRPLVVALREIDLLEAAYVRTGDVAGLADGASRLMRRVARRIDPSAASRSGAAWRTFVQAHAHDAAVRAALDDLLEARFRAAPLLDARALCAALRSWCRAALRRPVAPGRARTPAPGQDRASPVAPQPATAGEAVDAIRAKRVPGASA